MEPFFKILINFVKEQELWAGTPDDLLTVLEDYADPKLIKDPASWPQSAISLAKKIGNNENWLKLKGVYITKNRGRARIITLRYDLNSSGTCKIFFEADLKNFNQLLKLITFCDSERINYKFEAGGESNHDKIVEVVEDQNNLVHIIANIIGDNPNIIKTEIVKTINHDTGIAKQTIVNALDKGCEEGLWDYKRGARGAQHYHLSIA